MDIKNDVLENLSIEKKYLEIELIRIVNDNNTNLEYKATVASVVSILKDIAIIDGAASYLEAYFKTQTENQPTTSDSELGSESKSE